MWTPKNLMSLRRSVGLCIGQLGHDLSSTWGGGRTCKKWKLQAVETKKPAPDGGREAGALPSLDCLPVSKRILNVAKRGLCVCIVYARWYRASVGNWHSCKCGFLRSIKLKTHLHRRKSYRNDTCERNTVVYRYFKLLIVERDWHLSCLIVTGLSVAYTVYKIK